MNKSSVIPLLISLYPLVSALVSMLLAQFLKCLFCYLHDGYIDLKKWFSSGGMPSSHSAMVCSLSTAIGLKEGFTSSFFCICVVFSLIVLYDAAGVRQVVGKQAIILNHILEDVFEKGEFKPQKIKELLGHTPLEVLMGSLLGIGTAYTLFY
jgi:acid phosphatase family membrane protein YuiD